MTHNRTNLKALNRKIDALLVFKAATLMGVIILLIQQTM